MIAPFDIFRQEQDGQVLWIGIGASLDEAEKKVAEAMTKQPASYLIVSVRTGNRKTISPPDVSEKTF